MYSGLHIVVLVFAKSKADVAGTIKSNCAYVESVLKVNIFGCDLTME
jgi:hypothetical protein